MTQSRPRGQEPAAGRAKTSATFVCHPAVRKLYYNNIFDVGSHAIRFVSPDSASRNVFRLMHVCMRQVTARLPRR